MILSYELNMIFFFDLKFVNSDLHQYKFVLPWFKYFQIKSRNLLCFVLNIMLSANNK